MKYITSTFLLFSLFSFSAISQQVISSSGADSYTIGETIIFTSTDGKVTQGFHQPVLCVQSLLPSKIYDVSVYPNPTSDLIHVLWKDKEIKAVAIYLYSSDGKEVLAHRVKDSNEVVLDLSSFSSGYYILRICDDLNNTIEYEIVKQ